MEYEAAMATMNKPEDLAVNHFQKISLPLASDWEVILK